MKVSKINRFEGSNGDISQKDLVIVGKKSYGLTHSRDEKPVLFLPEIRANRNIGSTGLFLYNQNKKIGGLANFTELEYIKDVFQKLTGSIREYEGDETLKGYLFRSVPFQDERYERKIGDCEKILGNEMEFVNLKKSNPLKRISIIFDTRNGKFYSPKKEFKSLPPMRKVRKMEGNVYKTYIGEMGCCYPTNRLNL